jgi:hypothetical protein
LAPLFPLPQRMKQRMKQPPPPPDNARADKIQAPGIFEILLHVVLCLCNLISLSFHASPYRYSRWQRLCRRWRCSVQQRT